MKLLLLSNSTNPGEPYLGYPKQDIKQFIGDKTLHNIVFIPYAAITFSYDVYEQKVNDALAEIGIQVKSIHHFADPKQAIKEADAIFVGGGNTWKLVRTMRDNGLLEPIRQRVIEGAPYVGWSAGSNVACPTLRTTNDMPIIDPLGFDTLNLVPFQLNPHYLDVNPAGHGGETREMRIEEFLAQNPDMPVVGLRESTMLHLEDGKLKLIGDRTARIFKHGQAATELSSKDSFDFLMK